MHNCTFIWTLTDTVISLFLGAIIIGVALVCRAAYNTGRKYGGLW